MIKTIKWVFKAIIAGILSLVIASAICLIYYNPGIRITNKTGVTDYVWQSNYFASTMTEGIAWNRTDKNGFYNITDIDKNMDILMMGSSQMEGTNVFAKQKASYLLEELTSKSVYNIGTSGHGLLTCVKNLETALTVMEPTEYVIIEIGTTKFTEEAIAECLSGNMASISSYDSGILFQLQKIPYLKLVYAQLKSWDGVVNNDDEPQLSDNKTSSVDATPLDAYNQLTKKISDVCNVHNVQPIIFYHPQTNVSANGTFIAKKDEVSLVAFQTACYANNILFVDMTEAFADLYSENHVLPHGFCNTAVGKGHLNQYGHKAIAEKLTAIISDNFGHTEENQK